jgi:predicted ATPase
MELDAECSLGAARLAVSGFSGTDTGTTFQRAHELWELIGKPDKYIRVLWGEWLFHANRGSLQRARGISDEMLEIGEKRNNASALVLGSACSGNLLMLHGEFRQAQDEFRRCLNLFNPIDHGSLVHETGVDPRVNSLSFLGFVSFILGDPDVAFSYVAEAENIAKSLSHLPSLAMSLSIKTRLCSLFGDHDLLEQEADRLLRMGVENGFPFWRAQAQIYRGWLRVVRGDVEEGLGVLREGLSAYESTGAAVWLPLYRTFEAEAELRIGQPDAAIRILDRVILEARERRELWFMPELMRRRARILPDQAVRELSEAVKLSELQGSKMWQLRARLDLLRLANATSGRGAQSEAARLMENLMPNWSKSGHEKAHALALNALSDNQLSLA